MSKPVILVGGGGHARVLLGMLRRLELDVLGVVDPHHPVGIECQGVNVLGGDEALSAFSADQIELVNGIGSLPGDAGVRERLFRQFSTQGFYFKSVIDLQAFIAKDVVFAQGVQVMMGAIIQAGTQIAENCIINSGAIVEHDCRIGCHVHIAPGATLSGGVVVGDNVHIGTGAVVIQGIHIGSGSVIGAGSVVACDIDCRQIVYPARSKIQDL
jgi:sugar O-acyltransferase (sialic acid O-acetyltransferase NeuD family)